MKKNINLFQHLHQMRDPKNDNDFSELRRKGYKIGDLPLKTERIYNLFAIIEKELKKYKKYKKIEIEITPSPVENSIVVQIFVSSKKDDYALFHFHGRLKSFIHRSIEELNSLEEKIYSLIEKELDLELSNKLE